MYSGTVFFVVVFLFLIFKMLKEKHLHLNMTVSALYASYIKVDTYESMYHSVHKFLTDTFM